MKKGLLALLALAVCLGAAAVVYVMCPCRKQCGKPCAAPALLTVSEGAVIEPRDVAGKQVEWCMVGDSITWAGQGDYFRKYLLEEIPQLAFLGTHTARLGYSHAGEGGNNTFKVLDRIDDPQRVPDSRYYHLLIGINDSSAARSDEQVPKVARGTADRIQQIIEKMLAKPRTEKVFLGTIMPCWPGDNATDELKQRYVFRDAAGSATNVILREEIPARFGDKVVLIEYEKPLRARDDWHQIIRLHPIPEGYKVIAAIAAPVIRPHITPENRKMPRFGVEVTNLWNAEKKLSTPLLPGWYVLSFRAKKPVDGRISLTLRSDATQTYKFPFRKEFNLEAKEGERVGAEFYTGAEAIDYNQAPLEIADLNGEIDDIMIEKMRPTRQPSRYATGTFIDAESPLSLGEKFVPVE